MQKHELLINSKSKNYIVTIAIGLNYLNDWKKYALSLWKKYCRKHGIGLIVITENLINKQNSHWKKPMWQKMILGKYLSEAGLKIKNICYLDTDILINPFAPNIFDYHDEMKISLVSESHNLPYELDFVRRKLSFFRNRYYSKKYPLDSSLFMKVSEKYKFHSLKPQKDYVCTGVIIFNMKRFSSIMNKWFYKYKKNIKTLTGGGEEPILNYELFKTKKIKLLDYKFQALWMYEMALNYSFLYKEKKIKNNILKLCIENCLMNNYFLHFPGSWHEGTMWKIKNIFLNKRSLNISKNFNNYLNLKLTRKPAGRILPK